MSRPLGPSLTRSRRLKGLALVDQAHLRGQGVLAAFCWGCRCGYAPSATAAQAAAADAGVSAVCWASDGCSARSARSARSCSCACRCAAGGAGFVCRIPERCTRRGLGLGGLCRCPFRGSRASDVTGWRLWSQSSAGEQQPPVLPYSGRLSHGAQAFRLGCALQCAAAGSYGQACDATPFLAGRYAEQRCAAAHVPYAFVKAVHDVRIHER